MHPVSLARSNTEGLWALCSLFYDTKTTTISTCVLFLPLRHWREHNINFLVLGTIQSYNGRLGPELSPDRQKNKPCYTGFCRRRWEDFLHCEQKPPVDTSLPKIGTDLLNALKTELQFSHLIQNVDATKAVMLAETFVLSFPATLYYRICSIINSSTSTKPALEILLLILKKHFTVRWEQNILKYIKKFESLRTTDPCRINWKIICLQIHTLTYALPQTLYSVQWSRFTAFHLSNIRLQGKQVTKVNRWIVHSLQ